jgi:hypothetical protein
MGESCLRCGCNGHSITSAHWDMAIDNNGTWQNAYQFGKPDDFTWTLNGMSFAMDVQRTYYDTTPLLSLRSSAGKIVVDDPAQRVIHLNVPPDEVQAALRPGVYVYDLVMYDGSSPPIRTPLMHGTVMVSQGVTYPAP